jgi:hypothetical protein
MTKTSVPKICVSFESVARTFKDDATAVAARALAARRARRTALVIRLRPPGVILSSTRKQVPSSESVMTHPVLVSDVMMPLLAS